MSRILIVDDDPVSRNILQHFLAPYGDCDVAVNGLEALQQFDEAGKTGVPYNLIALDILMPEMDGQQTLKEIRIRERNKGISSEQGVKVIMTTSVTSIDHMTHAFQSDSEAYFVKPISKSKIHEMMNILGFRKRSGAVGKAT